MMKKTIARIAVSLTVAGMVASGGARPAAAQDVLLNPALKPAGAATIGVFDPSLASDDIGDVYISYSAIDPSVLWPGQNERAVQTYIARSANQGMTWDVLAGPINRARDVTLPEPPPRNAGTWHHEVSALVFDPSAQSLDERWKLFWHHYLVRDGVREPRNGWIGYKAARTPQLLALASEVKLFAGADYNAENDIWNGDTQTPLPGPPRIRLDMRFQELQGCSAFTEPGVTLTENALFLTMACVGPEPSKIFLLSCALPCDPTRPQSWSYARTAQFPYLLTEAEAAAFDKTGFSAPELFSFSGTDWLIATPTSDVPFPGAYNGCLVFEFYDIDTGRLRRHPNGVPIADAFISGEPGSFNGMCTVSARAYFGRFLYGEVEFTAPGEPFFKIFLSGQTFY